MVFTKYGGSHGFSIARIWSAECHNSAGNSHYADASLLHLFSFDHLFFIFRNQIFCAPGRARERMMVAVLSLGSASIHRIRWKERQRERNRGA